MDNIRGIIISLILITCCIVCSPSQSVNLELITDQDCYEPGDQVTVSFVTRMFIGNTTGCENTSSSSAQVRDLVYGMNFLLPDGSSMTQTGTPSGTTTTGGGITFSFADTDVLNNVTGAVNPSLDACDDTDISCEPSDSCPNGFDATTMVEADWIHTAVFTIPTGMTTGDLTLTANEDFIFWYNSSPPSGASWLNLGPGAVADTLVIPIQTNCLFSAELTDFQAERVLNKVSLNWTTQDEIDISEYQVQRSFDGEHFEPIGSRAPMYQLSNNRYQFWDDSPELGIQYYRLAILDLDGTIVYSDIRSVNYEKSLQPLVYPNPFSDVLNIEKIVSSDGSTDPTLIEVYNLTGQLMFSTMTNEENTINLEKLENGIYILQGKSMNYFFSKKIQKLD